MSKYSFLARWFIDKDDCAAMEKHIDWFLDQFPVSLQTVVEKLLHKYDYYDELPLEVLFDEYKIRLKYFINSNNIDNYVITMPFDKDSHNSYSFATIFKMFDVSGTGAFISRVSDNEYCNYKNIIFVDDYSGTGTSFIDFLINKKDFIPKTTRVFFLPCFITATALKNITKSIVRNLVILSSDVSLVRMAKYIEEQHILNDVETKQLINHSISSLKIMKSLVRGYGNTEDLLSLNYMTPNNTVALFWWNSNTLYYPLFKRNGFGQKNNIRHPRFKYDFIKTYNESIKSGASKKMREYLIIAILLFLGNDISSVKKQCNFKNYDFDDGIKYLKNQKILDDLLSPSLLKIKTFIDIDRIIVFQKTGIAYNSYLSVIKNLIKTIQ